MNNKLTLPFHEFEFEHSRSRGPGGQHVNRTNSAVQLRWNIVNSQSLLPEVKARLILKLQNRLTTAGEILVRSESFRDQESNRKACLEKLLEIIKQALHTPKKRIKTKPTKSSQRKRLDNKIRRSEIKSSRQKTKLPF